MTQTLAIFLDAYRDLNSRKLFWITLIISALVIGVFGLFGVAPDGVTILGLHIPSVLPEYFYKQIFDWVVLWFWLSIAATVLALVSTGGVFPDFLTGGSVDLYLAKPIGRLRLFLTKYLAGLLFVFLQVAVFAAGAFLVLGLGLGTMETQPVYGRSTGGPLFQLFVFVVRVARHYHSLHNYLTAADDPFLGDVLRPASDGIVHPMAANRCRCAGAALSAAGARGPIGARQAGGTSAGFNCGRRYRPQPLPETVGQGTRSTGGVRAVDPRNMHLAHNISYGLVTFLPKTSETTNMMDRWLYSDKEIEEKNDQDDANSRMAFAGSDQMSDYQQVQKATHEHDKMLRDRSPVWIIGTSVVFEAVLVAWAAWLFCRHN